MWNIYVTFVLSSRIPVEYFLNYSDSMGLSRQWTRQRTSEACNSTFFAKYKVIKSNLDQNELKTVLKLFPIALEWLYNAELYNVKFMFMFNNINIKKFQSVLWRNIISNQRCSYCICHSMLPWTICTLTASIQVLTLILSISFVLTSLTRTQLRKDIQNIKTDKTNTL